MINYNDLLSYIKEQHPDNHMPALIQELEYKWCDEYDAMTNNINSINSINFGAFTLLFDLTSEINDLETQTIHEDRVVVFYGTSLKPSLSRDTNRMRGFIGKTGMVFGSKFDKGHFISHGAGGGYLDSVNWFPQLRSLNRGWSEQGKRYRAMEKYTADNPGTFFFSRPIYEINSKFKRSWTPDAIEFGILIENKIWAETFDNTEPMVSTNLK